MYLSFRIIIQLKNENIKNAYVEASKLLSNVSNVSNVSNDFTIESFETVSSIMYKLIHFVEFQIPLKNLDGDITDSTFYDNFNLHFPANSLESLIGKYKNLGYSPEIIIRLIK